MQIPVGGKKFEKAEAGVALGTIIDVVDLGLVASKNPQFPEAKYRIRIVWVLNQMDSEGNPKSIIEQPPQRMTDGGGGSKKSRLYEITEGVFGVAPTVSFDPETLIGRSNQLFLVKDGDYTNIKGFLPVPAGTVAPTVPVGFVRAKDKPAQTIAAQTAAPATAAAQATTAVAVSTAADEDIPF